jgi:hypothetical protein
LLVQCMHLQGFAVMSSSLLPCSMEAGPQLRTLFSLSPAGLSSDRLPCTAVGLPECTLVHGSAEPAGQ